MEHGTFGRPVDILARATQSNAYQIQTVRPPFPENLSPRISIRLFEHRTYIRGTCEPFLMPCAERFSKDILRRFEDDDGLLEQSGILAPYGVLICLAHRVGRRITNSRRKKSRNVQPLP